MKPQKIARLYAWIVTHEDGEEGVPAISTPIGALPMIGADKARIESLRAHAMASLGILDPIDQGHGRTVKLRLVRFDRLVLLETHDWKHDA